MEIQYTVIINYYLNKKIIFQELKFPIKYDKLAYSMILHLELSLNKQRRVSNFYFQPILQQQI